jgi:hypothetical protein
VCESVLASEILYLGSTISDLSNTRAVPGKFRYKLSSISDAVLLRYNILPKRTAKSTIYVLNC